MIEGEIVPVENLKDITKDFRITMVMVLAIIVRATKRMRHHKIQKILLFLCKTVKKTPINYMFPFKMR
jgi:hypothetical protein